MRGNAANGALGRVSGRGRLLRGGQICCDSVVLLLGAGRPWPERSISRSTLAGSSISRSTLAGSSISRVDLGRKFHQPVDLGRKFHQPVDLGRKFHQPVNLGRKFHQPVNLGRQQLGSRQSAAPAAAGSWPLGWRSTPRYILATRLSGGTPSWVVIFSFLLVYAGPVVGEGLEEAVDVVAPGPLLNYTLLPVTEPPISSRSTA